MNVPISNLIRMSRIDENANPGLYEELVKSIDWDEVSTNSADLTDEFINAFKDKLNWTLLTRYHRFDTDSLVKYRMYINWSVASRYQTLSTDVISIHKDKVNWTDICEYQILPSSFIHIYHRWVNWDKVSIHQILDNYIFEEHSLEINWVYASKYQNISDSFIRNNPTVIDWNGISSKKRTNEFLDAYKDLINWECVRYPLGLDFVIEHASYVNWTNVSTYENMTDSFMATYAENIDWVAASSSQMLSESIIRAHSSDVNWTDISIHQPLTESFIDEFKAQVDWQMIAMYQVLSESFIESHMIYLYKYIAEILTSQTLNTAFRAKYSRPVQIKSLGITYTVGEDNLNTIIIANNTGYTGTYKFNISDNGPINVTYGQILDGTWETIESGESVTIAPNETITVVLVDDTITRSVASGSVKIIPTE